MSAGSNTNNNNLQQNDGELMKTEGLDNYEDSSQLSIYHHNLEKQYIIVDSDGTKKIITHDDIITRKADGTISLTSGPGMFYFKLLTVKSCKDILDQYLV